MNFLYETDRLIMKVEHYDAANKVLDFYINNKMYFEKWELTRPHNFYTEAYQSAVLKAEYDEMIRRHFVRFYVYEKENLKDIVGAISISNIHLGCLKNGMLGYKLDYRHYKKGYAREACENMIEIAKQEYGLHRLESYIMPANEPSICLIERLGFFYEGTDRKSAEVNHKYEDHLRYAKILDEE